jgi:hypothetical protein
VAGILSTENRFDAAVFSGDLLLQGRRGALEVERYRGREHLDVADLLGAGVEEHVSVAIVAAVAPALEEVLQANSDLALDSADGLLQHLGKEWVGAHRP